MGIIGIIKWFDKTKGFGVIETSIHGEYFLHKSNFVSSLNNLNELSPVIFLPEIERGKKAAKECHFPENADDLFTILQFMDENPTVRIKTKVKGISRWGNRYTKDEFIDYNVFCVSIKFLFAKKSNDELFEIITAAYLKLINTLDDFNYNFLFRTIAQEVNQLSIEDTHQLNNKLFNFYGENLSEDILFSIWKTKNFKYIGKSNYDDYEIPVDLLLRNYEELTDLDLKRIQNYENGDETCFNIVSEKIKDISHQMTSIEIVDLYKYVEFIKSKPRKEKLELVLNELCYKKLLEEISTALDDLPDEISNKDFLLRHDELNQLIPDKLDEIHKESLAKIIADRVIDKSDKQMEIELWLFDYLSEVAPSQVVDFILDENTSQDDKLKGLSKIYDSESISFILQQLVEQKYIEETYELIESFIRVENDLGYFKLQEKTKDFNKDIIGYNLVEIYEGILLRTVTKEEQVKLFFKGWLHNYPRDYITYIAPQLIESELRKIFHNDNTNEEFKFELLVNKCKQIADDELDWFLRLCHEYLSEDEFSYIDIKLNKRVSGGEWFKLWQNKLTRVLRKEFLLEYFDEDKKKYNLILKWINDEILTKDIICDFFYEKLELSKNISDRREFYTAFNIVQKLLEIESNAQEIILNFENKFLNLLLWHLGEDVAFDFQELKGKFIYFNPNDQVYIFKRLFYLKHIGEIDFTIEELDEIVRADVDLYLSNEKFQNDFVLDISTHVIIEAVKSYLSKKSFLFESDLILKDLKNNSKKRFKLGEYFEECPGRLIANWNWKTNGKIRKIPFPNDKERFYYSIEFTSGSLVESHNHYRTYTYFEKNPLFDNLKEDVKKITGRKWNPEKKHWGVPSSSSDEVYEFAKKHRFFIDLGDRKHYDNNTHLVEYSRDDKPNGIDYCEGRKSNKEHDKMKCDFWWCTNQPCFEFAEVDNLSNNTPVVKEPSVVSNIFAKAFPQEKNKLNASWLNYKLLDILRVLEINTDEQKENPEDFITDGNYYKLIGHINAFNRLVDKLYCRECNELLYPTETSHFALYRDTKFHCENKQCVEYKKVIYLNHCLNGECKNIIDSRVSKPCDNGLYICDSCGTCCSDLMFKRRLDNLRLVGGYIHDGLEKSVQEEKGHLEKAEYYCYKCKGMMTEVSDKKFECSNCGVTYDLKDFMWIDRKWVKKSKRRRDYPILGSLEGLS
jgi:cold shock CspA family protein